MTAFPSTESTISPAVHRVVVHPRPGEQDPHAAAIVADASHVMQGLDAVHTARVFLIEAPLDESMLRRIADELLADPVSQQPVIGASEAPGSTVSIEVHYQPGVMDPVAQSTRDAIIEMFPSLASSQGDVGIEVRTGFRYDFQPREGATLSVDDACAFADQHLANTVIQDIHVGPFHPQQFEHGHPYHFQLRHVAIRDLDDDALMTLSRDGHLFLSLDEMRCVRDYYRDEGREPTDIELETLAQTWSEHCVHKTLKSTIHYSNDSAIGHGQDAIDWANRPGHELHEDGSVTIHNLLKSTVAAATHKLMEREDLGQWCISVFEDNAGIVGFDDEDAVCIKVETHNHPSAIEPYGGAATGIGGCIRDIMGTGLFARPIANTDVFCVAPSGESDEVGELPKGVLHPRRVLEQVVGGVRDYGNRMGIPTVNGAVAFHRDYLANPLVYCGCIGLIPRDKCFGDAQPGDHIIALGGRTGRDGIHGATFSSDELTDTHADEFSHAVQIGNAITQKKTMDVILQARDHESGCLFSAITDCGAGGFSSAVGEMGEKVGAEVTLENAPLKYAGLSYTEVWISEAQERMVLAVPESNLATLRQLCEAEDVEMCDLGTFGVRAEQPPVDNQTNHGGAVGMDEQGEWIDRRESQGEPLLVLRYHGNEVARLSMRFMHDGIPTPTRTAKWTGGRNAPPSPTAKSAKLSSLPVAGSEGVAETLLALLGHPNIASKHWIIRQYDHEVQGGSVVKPLTGPQQDGPSDAAVVRPKLTSDRGIALGCGLQTGLGEKSTSEGVASDGDAYWMVLAAIDEAVRNVVCTGADASRIAILDNFCWPKCDDPAQLGSLVRAAEGCYDGALAYGTPFVSGKDSLSNQFTTEDGKLITIPPTMLITALGIVNDVTRCVTMDAKAAGNVLLVVGSTTGSLGGSHLAMLDRAPAGADLRVPRVDILAGPRHASAVAKLIEAGHVRSAHDCSDGGLLVAAAEMAFAGRLGLAIDLDGVPVVGDASVAATCFAETPSRYLLEVEAEQLDRVIQTLREQAIPFGQVGRFEEGSRLTLRSGRHGRLLDASLDECREAWLRPLDW